MGRSRRGADWQPDEVWVADVDDDDTDGRRAATGRPATEMRAEPRPAADRPRVRTDRQRLDRPADDTDATTQKPGAQPGSGHRHNVPAPVVDELTDRAGSQRGAKLAARLADASHAYERDRYQEARRILRPLADEVPDSAAVQELYGLTLYRMGQWALAARHLEKYRESSGEHDQHPVLADCYRALRRYADAEALWDELREASPSAELVAEGRIVAAGCRADQGDLRGAIALLEKAAKKVGHPAAHHLRQWYVLADLYERAGDLPRARELFTRVAAADPEAFDVRTRLRALR